MIILLVPITQSSVLLISVGAPSPDNFLIDKATDLIISLGRLVAVGLKNNENALVMMLKHISNSCIEPDDMSRHADMKSSTQTSMNLFLGGIALVMSGNAFWKGMSCDNRDGFWKCSE